MTIGRRALPSNSVLVVSTIVTAVAVVLSVLGPDYIGPGTALFDFSSSMSRRAISRAVSSAAPYFTISKAMWTSGSRLGITAFALMPLVVLLALKAPPFALFSLPFFTSLYADKLVNFHRIAGWLIWGLTTAHVALWSVQLFQDKHNGKAMWFTIFASQRFIFGCVAYFCMTLLTILSIRPIRRTKYEFFYYAHVVLVALTLVACVLHHPILWYWIAAAAALWVGDRLWRTFRSVWINSGASRNPPNGVATKGRYGPGEDIVLEEFTDKMLPAIAYDEAYVDQGYAQGEFQPLGTYDAAYAAVDDESRGSLLHGQRRPSGGLQQPRSRHDSTYSITSLASLGTMGGRQIADIPPPPPVPAGYAQAQLLPSRTIRLTIHTPRPIKWRPGQSVLLTLPDLSRLQSHPFTICNNDRHELVLLIKARKGLTRKLYDLVRKRSEQSISASSMRSGVIPVAAPVYIRARLDGPMGSSKNIRWNAYSTILIICGGSGVSFGLGVCDYLCNMMANGGFNSKTRRVRFVWIVREYSEIAWAASALWRARQMVLPHQLGIDIYVTNAAPKENALYDEFAPPKPAYSGLSRTGSSDSINSDFSRTSELDGVPDSFDLEMQNANADAAELTNYYDEEDFFDPAEAALSRKVQKQGKARRARTRKTAKRAHGQEEGGRRPSAGYAARVPSPGAPPLPAKDAQYSTAFDSRRGSRVDIGNGRPSFDSIGAPPFSPGHPHRQSMAPSLAPTFGSESHLLAPSNMGPDPRRYSHASSDGRRFSQQSLDPRRMTSSSYDTFDPYMAAPGLGSAISPAPSIMFDDADSIRNSMALRSRTQSMVLLPDAGGKEQYTPSSSALWIDEADYAAMSILSEMAHGGRPKLGAIFQEETQCADGSMLVAGEFLMSNTY